MRRKDKIQWGRGDQIAPESSPVGMPSFIITAPPPIQLLSFMNIYIERAMMGGAMLRR